MRKPTFNPIFASFLLELLDYHQIDKAKWHGKVFTREQVEYVLKNKEKQNA